MWECETVWPEMCLKFQLVWNTIAFFIPQLAHPTLRKDLVLPHDHLNYAAFVNVRPFTSWLLKAGDYFPPGLPHPEASLWHWPSNTSGPRSRISMSLGPYMIVTHYTNAIFFLAEHGTAKVLKQWKRFYQLRIIICKISVLYFTLEVFHKFFFNRILSVSTQNPEII